VATLMKKMGDRGDLPAAEHLEAGAGAQDLSLPAAQPGGDAAQPGLGDGHHLHPDGAGVRLSRRRRRLVQPQGPGLAALDHAVGDFCIEALEEALARHGKPEIFNTDQGSQFTSTDFTKVLKNAEIAISMDGKGAWRDNVFVERLWRTIKYEEVYLRAYAGVSKPAPRSAGISASTTARGRIHRLAGKRPIRPTSTWRRQSRRQPSPRSHRWADHHRSRERAGRAETAAALPAARSLVPSRHR
jgi:hypothetical protein